MTKRTRTQSQAANAQIVDAQIVDAQIVDADLSIAERITVAAHAAAAMRGTTIDLSKRDNDTAQLVCDALALAGVGTVSVAAANYALGAAFALAGGALSFTAVSLTAGGVLVLACFLAFKYLDKIIQVSTWVCNHTREAVKWIVDTAKSFWNWLCSFFEDEEEQAKAAA